MTRRSDEGDWRRHVVEQVLPRMDANTGPAATGFTPAPTETTVTPTPLPGAPHISPQFDVIELLPPGAADKLRKLRLRRKDAHRLIPEFESVREASLAKTDAAVRRGYDDSRFSRDRASRITKEERHELDRCDPRVSITSTGKLDLNPSTFVASKR